MVRNRLDPHVDLVVGFGLILALFGVVVAMIHTDMVDTQRSRSLLFRDKLATVSDLAGLGANLNSERLEVSLMLDSGATETQAFRSEIERLSRQDQGSIARLLGAPVFNQDRFASSGLAEYISLRRELLRARDEVILPLAEKGRVSEARRLFGTAQLARYVRMKDILRDLQADVEGQVRREIQLTDQGERNHLARMLMAGGAALLLALGVFGFVSASLRRYVANREAVAADLAGNLARLRQLIDCAPEAIVVLDLDRDRFVDASRSAENLFMCNRNQLLASSVSRFIASGTNGPGVDESFNSAASRALAGELVVIERRIASATGGELRCELRLVALPVADRRWVRASIIDIGDRETPAAAVRAMATVGQSLDDGVVVHDRAGLIVAWNIGAERIFGISAHEAIGRSADDLLPGYSVAQLGARVDQAGVIEPFERELANKDGAITLSARVLAISGGQAGGERLAAIWRDISELKRLQFSLRQVEFDLSLTQRLGRVGSWEFDAATGDSVCSEAFFRISGRDAVSGEKKSCAFRDTFSSASISLFDGAVRRCLESGGGFELDLLLVRPDGGSCWVMARGEAMRDRAGKINEVYGILHDITERKQIEEELRRHRESLADQVKARTIELDLANHELRSQIAARDRAELALRESEAKFRSVLENSLDAGYRRNLKSDRYDYMSPVIERLVGIPAAEFTHFGMDEVLDRIHPDDAWLVKREFEQLVSGDKDSVAVEYRFRGVDGQFRWLSDNCNVLKNERGVPKYLVGIVRDVSRHKQADDVILRLNRELGGYAARLEVINGQLRSVSRSNTMFLAALASEFKLRLEAIIGAADSLPVGQEQPDSTNLIKESAGHLVGLLDDVVAIAGSGKALAMRIDLEQLLRTIAAGNATARAARINVACRGSSNSWITADRNLIQRLLGRLIDSAAKAGAPDFELALLDDPVGVEIVMPYFAEADACCEPVGDDFPLPLGAAVGCFDACLVRQMVASAGGRIEILASPDNGRSVTLRLPRDAG